MMLKDQKINYAYYFVLDHSVNRGKDVHIFLNVFSLNKEERSNIIEVEKLGTVRRTYNVDRSIANKNQTVFRCLFCC